MKNSERHLLERPNTELEKLLTPIPTGGQATNASITKDLIATFKALED